MANKRELLVNLVNVNKPKMLTGLGQKACDRLLGVRTGTRTRIAGE